MVKLKISFWLRRSEPQWEFPELPPDAGVEERLEERLVAQPASPEITNNITTRIFTCIFHLIKVGKHFKTIAYLLTNRSQYRGNNHRCTLGVGAGLSILFLIGMV